MDAKHSRLKRRDENCFCAFPDESITMKDLLIAAFISQNLHFTKNTLWFFFFLIFILFLNFT